MSLLNTIRKGKRQLPPRVLAYGPGGIGLSTFAAEAPNPIFLATENGIACDSFPTCENFEEIISCLKSLKNEENEYRTVVIDTIDWVERLFLSEVRKLQETDTVTKSDGGFGQNDDLTLLYWRQMADALNSLRDEKEMTVVLLAREKLENPSGTKQFSSLELRRPTAAFWCEWCDVVLHATFKFATASSGNDSTVLLRDTTTKCNIKNRYNIPETLPFRWSSLSEHFAPMDNPSH